MNIDWIVVVPLTRLTLQQRDALNDYFVAKTGADLETHMGEIVQDFHLCVPIVVQIYRRLD